MDFGVFAKVPPRQTRSQPVSGHSAESFQKPSSQQARTENIHKIPAKTTKIIEKLRKTSQPLNHPATHHTLLITVRQPPDTTKIANSDVQEIARSQLLFQDKPYQVQIPIEDYEKWTFGDVRNALVDQGVESFKFRRVFVDGVLVFPDELLKDYGALERAVIGRPGWGNFLNLDSKFEKILSNLNNFTSPPQLA